RELRSETKTVLDAVANGKTVTVTRRGKPLAQLVPIADTRVDKPKPLAGFGMWADRQDMEDVEGWLRNLRKPRHALRDDPPANSDTVR
ncbi:MAG: type II toxin-antitoxin system prevent-host-death family antitoxin, partial [Salinisphaera sp.]|nr:type II toxin-antitoxin system prevent-host-death family antitoxin [Salinisphaera sp.]